MILLYLFLDYFVVWGIVRLLAGFNVSEYKLHFMGFVIGVAAVGFFLAGVGPALILPIYFAATVIGMVVVLGTTWTGGLIGGASFVAYKIALGIIANAVFN